MGYRSERRIISSINKRTIYFVRFLEEQDRAVIGGGAGTGKTILAVEHAKRLGTESEKFYF